MNNLNYGDTGLMVQYLQYFLRDNYSTTIRMSGTYDEYTHKKLKEYLDMPNILIYTKLIPLLQAIDLGDEFSNIYRYPFAYMQVHGEENSIVFYLKNPKSIKGYNESNISDRNDYEVFKSFVPILRTAYKSFKTIVDDNGWQIIEYPSMYSNRDEIDDVILKDVTSIAIVLKHKTPTDIFPHYDMRYMINYFNNNYINDIEILPGYFRKSNKYRVALVNCKAGDTFVIAHGYSYSVPIRIGFCVESENDIKDIIYTSNNNAKLKIYYANSFLLNKFIPGVPMLIKVPEESNREYQTMLIEIPYLSYTQQVNVDKQTPMSYIDTFLKVGDINNDGDIDEIDRLIFACQRPVEMGMPDGVFYFNSSYDRYDELCACVDEKYRKLFKTNIDESADGSEILSNFHGTQYNTTYKYSETSPVKVGVDTLVKHLQFFCSGSSIKFQRTLINGDINYKITIDEDTQPSKNMAVLNDSVYNFTVGKFDLYLTDPSKGTILVQYMYDDTSGSSNTGYGLSDFNNSNGVRIICKSGMSNNNLLVIKTNPNDNIKDCSKILNGNYNDETDGTLILPIADFKDEPWMIREDFYQALLENMVTPYSIHEDIAYIYYLSEVENNMMLRGAFGDEKFVFSDELRIYLKSVQNMNNSPFSLGYFDKTAYSVLFKSAYETYILNMKAIFNQYDT